MSPTVWIHIAVGKQLLIILHAEREGEWKGRREKEEGREREGKEEEDKKERKGEMNEKFSAELLEASTYG